MAERFFKVHWVYSIQFQDIKTKKLNNLHV